MTGYQSKKAAALDEEGMYLVHQTEVKTQYPSEMYDQNKIDQAIAFIKEALAQPAQEPVKFKCTVVDDQHPQGIPLEQWGNPPAAQRPWVGLSSVDFNDFNPLFTAEAAARWAEAKLKEKNNG